MHTVEDITIETITKIEGNAKLNVKVSNGIVEDLEFIIADYRRFYTEAVRGKPYMTVPTLLSRICGTCSMAHLMASIKAIERALGIHEQLSEQTNILRKLSINGMIIRDHALHLYIFSLPDVLGIDSVLDISEDNAEQHQLLHDAFDLKAVGNKLSTVFAGAAIHSPFPTVGGFLKLPSGQDFSSLVDELEQSRVKILRGIKVFYEWNEKLVRNTDFIALINDDYNFTEGIVKVSDREESYTPDDFLTLLDEIIIPYSQSKGYKLKSKHDDFMVGSLARVNMNLNRMHPRTLESAKRFLDVFPSFNVYHNCLAQALEVLHCIDQSIDMLKGLRIEAEPIIKASPKSGVGVGVIEAPRGTLYHKVETDEKGIVIFSDVIVPTSQNQINIENDLKQMFQENLNLMSREDIKWKAEEIIRAYDPCMSCSTNFLDINWQE